jgi:xylulokinase
MAAALGLNLTAGDVAVSIGTSGTAFCISDTVPADPSGSVSGFSDATGRYLPLVCTVNASRILTVAGSILGVDHDQLANLALAGEPGANGLTLLPYLDGERTPNRPTATGILHGLTSATRREDLARAAVEALLCSLADATDALHTPTERILLVGGASRNPAVQQIAPAIFGMPIHVPPPDEYVALGAARQAAWALSGAMNPPTWITGDSQLFTATPTPGARTRYAKLRDATTHWEW